MRTLRRGLLALCFAGALLGTNGCTPTIETSTADNMSADAIKVAWLDWMACRVGLDSLCEKSTGFADGATDLTSYLADGETRGSFYTSFSTVNNANEPGRYEAYVAALEPIVAADDALSGIAISDLVAVRGYTSDKSATRPIPDYKTINDALRRRDETALSTLEAYIKVASSGLNQLAPYQDVVYRNTTLPEQVLAGYAEGTDVIERSFTSSSVVSLQQFAGNAAFVVSSRTGREISELSVFTNEREVLFAPGSQFHVRQVSKDSASGVTTIWMDEIE